MSKAPQEVIDSLYRIVRDDKFDDLSSILSLYPLMNQRISPPSESVPQILGDYPPILSIACFYNSFESVKNLLLNKAEIRQTDGSGLFPIHFAAAGGSMQIIHYLEEKGASFVQDVNDNDNLGNIPLSYAIEFNHLEVVQYILSKNPRLINHKNKSESTFMHIAASCGFLNIANFLKDNGASIDSPDQYQYRPLHFASQNNHGDLVTFLLQNGADPTHKCIGEQTALSLALSQCCLSSISAFYDFGISLDEPNEANLTPLMIASQIASNELIEFLLKKKMTIDKVGYKNRTALMFAVISGDETCVELLLDANADMSLVDLNENNVFHLAAKYDQKDVLSLLFDKLNDDNLDLCSAENSKGRTPLYYAVSLSSIECTSLLLENGVDHQLDDLLPIAEKNGDQEIIALLNDEEAVLTSD